MAVTITINGDVTEAAAGDSLFDCAERVGVRVPTSCHKQGKCKECMVEVTEGMERLSPPADAERHLSGRFRLSCSTRVASPGGEVRCHTMRRGHLHIESRGEGLAGCHAADFTPRTGYGIAMDLGTTTVVLRLFNLETGELVADASFENPQRFGGSDVMARIHYDTTHPGKLLRRTLAGYLTHAIEEFPVDPRSIGEMVVVGNSTMRDLFFRQSVYSIGQSPYRSITELDMAQGKRATTSLVETGRRCLLPIHPEAHVYGAPIISGHVGADAAACMLAIDLAHEDRLVAVMDIGTNTELILGNRHRILAASCPAGPAFEGGAIACGMPALDGAVADVRIDESGGYRLEVIGGGAPTGICGSGLIALLSELRRTGQMNERGRFEDDLERVTLAPDVYFLESDVNELAQAKGANVAGLQTVCSNYGVSFDDIEVFYLAGGFGRHIDVDAAALIGLIPPIPRSRIVQVGNAAIEGASIALLSESKRRELEHLVLRAEHCRLETHPRFFDFFVDGCLLRPVESAHQVAE
ncbi:MAG TPA: ASKHA domain-containing protein [Candidatus Sulfopaludibacter sp.]|nr:ASKHA domain-containing protein [Candidatus Sulfopaludibacter sp.]